MLTIIVNGTILNIPENTVVTVKSKDVVELDVE